MAEGGIPVAPPARTDTTPIATTAPPPAIVIGRGYTGLGAMRCLAMAGIPAYLACPPGDLATRSRWYRPLPGVDGGMGWDGTFGASAIEALRSLPLERAVLIAGADDACLWLSSLADRAPDLAARFPCSIAALPALRILQDKQRLSRFLHRVGVPHPRTFPLRRIEDIDRIPFDRLARVFLKPVDSQRFNRIIGHKGLWPSDRDDCKAMWQRLDAQGLATVAQEYVPGGPDSHWFIDGFRDRDGVMRGLFARQRHRIFPADFGNSSYCQSVPLSQVDDALASLQRVLERLRYRGIFSAEFKRDPRDGRFLLLEINTRAWWYVEFAARCGVNVCEMAWRDAQGLAMATPVRDYRIGAGCTSLLGDVRAVLTEPSGARTPRRRVLKQWLGSHLHAFRWDDPLPGLVLCWQFVRDRFRKPTVASARVPRRLVRASTGTTAGKL